MTVFLYFRSSPDYNIRRVEHADAVAIQTGFSNFYWFYNVHMYNIVYMYYIQCSFDVNLQCKL